MCLDFGGAESKVVGVAADLLGAVGVGDEDGDVGLGDPATLLGRVVPEHQKGFIKNIQSTRLKLSRLLSRLL